MSTSIEEDLLLVGAISSNHKDLFSVGTRDNSDLLVYKDRLSGVIYIPDYYCGINTYKDGVYRNDALVDQGKDFKNLTCVTRYQQRLLQFYAGKIVLDFGCGNGAFLQAVQCSAKRVVGVEVQADFCRTLTALGIECFFSLTQIEVSSVDTVFLFHNFEHLPNPLQVLNQLYDVLKPGGNIIMEVPHANDFLIRYLAIEEAIKFILWSQHLVLHTRESLRLLLSHVGFTDVIVTGIQRYSISNHMNWLLNSQPGGHLMPLSLFETSQLAESYSDALGIIDANDTLLVVAQKPSSVV